MVGKKRTSNSRTLIIEKAREMMWEKGYQETSMRDIVRATSLELGSIYNYFPNKELILYQILLNEMLTQIAEVKHLDKDDKTSPAKQLHFIISNQVNHTVGHEKGYGMLFDTGLRVLDPDSRKRIIELRDQYENILRKVIRRGIEKGIFINLDEKFAAIMIISMVVRLRVWFSPKGKLSKEEVANRIHRFALNCLLKSGQKEVLLR